MERKLMVGATLLSLLMAASACGSSDPRPASGSTLATDACVKEAKTATESATATPDLVAPPPLDIGGIAGKELWLIQPAQVKIQHDIGDAFVDAAKAAGASGKVFYSDGSSKSALEGMTQAVAQKPAGIVVNVHPDLVAKQIKDARDAGISVVTLFQEVPGEALPEGVQANVPSDWVGRGRDMANWILADSGCKADAAVLHLSAFPAANLQEDGIHEVFDGLCKACDLVNASIDLAQLGTSVPSATQSVLRANPNADYLLALFDSLATLSAPAVSSLRPGVKVLGGDGVDANLQMVRDGTQAVDVLLPPPTWVGFAVVDQLARMILGEQPWKVSVPRRLIDKTNIGDATTVTELFPGYENTQQEFMKAWGLE